MDLVAQLFRGVTDKAGEPYFTHCLRVLNLLPEGVSQEERHAALLHDVFEDTDFPPSDLLARGYSEKVVELVTVLTKHPAESYAAYISRVAGSPAERIKRADLTDNSDPERLAALPELVRSRLEQKYQHALSILNFVRDHPVVHAN